MLFSVFIYYFFHFCGVEIKTRLLLLLSLLNVTLRVEVPFFQSYSFYPSTDQISPGTRIRLILEQLCLCHSRKYHRHKRTWNNLVKMEMCMCIE